MNTVTNPMEGRTLTRLSAIGVSSPEQLLLHLPKNYDDFTQVSTTIEQPFMSGERILVLVTVDSYPDLKSKAPPRLHFYVKDASKRVGVTVFGNCYDFQKLKVGESIVLRCKVGQWNDELQLESPELISLDKVGKIWPSYQGKKGVVSPDSISSIVQGNFAGLVDEAAMYIRRHFDGLPDLDILRGAKQEHYRTLANLLNVLHRPKSIQEGLDALHAARLVATYEALYNARKRQNRRPDPDSILTIKQAHIENLVARLPFALTNDQRTALDDMVNDLRRPYPMYRLISGDVGTGKTEPLLIALAAARASGARVALMVPNLLLAIQATERAKKYWPKIPVCMVAGKAKLDLEGDPIVIGTTAILGALEKKKWVPHFLVVDEQAKFSRAQRERLLGLHTNLAEATATCIPRSAALILNGGMDISTINECPVKKIIHSKVVTVEDRGRLIDHIRKVTEAGGQVAVLYPNVNAASKKGQRSSVVDAVGMFEKLFPKQVAVLHGGLTQDEKVDTIKAMEEGKFKILCCSSLIEIGITLPSLRAVAVIEADKFGVSQLHQIRGRVARLGGVGYFFMYLPKEVSEETMERLQLVASETDGFKLAELDMEIRGFGDLSVDSDQQHGINRSALFTGVKIKPSDLRLLA